MLAGQKKYRVRIPQPSNLRNPDVAGVPNEHDLNMLTRVAEKIAASRNPSFPLRKTASVSVEVSG
jgi:hypothetical protein